MEPVQSKPDSKLAALAQARKVRGGNKARKKEHARKISETAAHNLNSTRQKTGPGSEQESNPQHPPPSPNVHTVDTHPLDDTPVRVQAHTPHTSVTPLTSPPTSQPSTLRSSNSRHALPPTPIPLDIPALDTPTPSTTHAASAARKGVSGGERAVWDVTLLAEDFEKCGRCPACSRGEESFMQCVKELHQSQVQDVVRVVPDFVYGIDAWVTFSEQFQRDVSISCGYYKFKYYVANIK